MSMAIDVIKKNVAATAVELVAEGMLVGLGSGTTTTHFIDFLGERCRNGLSIKAVASSSNSLRRAKEKGIPIIDINTIEVLDLTVDGADEIDSQKQMIKGGGGALVREKILASMSREMIVIIDETKLVKQLGKHPLPVEVVSFGRKATFHKLEKLGYRGVWRTTEQGELFITDNGNHIIDIHFHSPCEDPHKEHERILHLPGVVDTGFFFNLAGRVIVGFKDGQVVIRE